MRNVHSTVAVVAVLAAAFSIACSQDATKSQPVPAAPSASAPSELAAEAVNPRLLRRFQPLPIGFDDDANPRSQERIDVGRQLFYDPRLSKDEDLSCNSCHDLESYGVDHTRTSKGHKNQLGTRNSPTVYNAAGSFTQFWDGRATNIEEQAKGPILNPVEMAMPDAAHVVARLKSVPGYVEAFRKAFPGESDPVTYANLGKAIGAFERGLVTPGRWDTFLRGDDHALSKAEKQGLKTFVNIGCMVCHTGPLLGGSMFERVGVVEPWPNQTDKGRNGVTKVAADAMMFKVPTLRNVEKTAPYFHDASAATLEEAVRMMGKHQLGLELTESEIGGITAWLKSLTGDLPAAYIAKPELPR